MGCSKTALKVAIDLAMDWRVMLSILIVPIVGLVVWYGTSYFFASEQQTGPQITFEAEGNMMKDNPGFEAGVWYLSYEKPGQPGLSTPLLFDHASECGGEGSFAICNISFEPGERVRVEGEEMGQVVHVLRLTYMH